MEKLVIILVLVLAVMGTAQIAKVYQLASTLRKRREEDISDTSNRINANIMLAFVILFFASFVWLLVEYSDTLIPPAASEHGQLVDSLFTVNWIILIFVFVVVNWLLFYFAWKYVKTAHPKALYLAHNNKLELLWTVIPSVVLAFIIIYGLRTWNEIMGAPEEGALVVELYGRQFDWTARYAGSDGELGAADYGVISGMNPLGLITDKSLSLKIDELHEEIKKIKSRLDTEVMPDDKAKDLQEDIAQRTRQVIRLKDMKKNRQSFVAAKDDKLVKGEFHLPVGREVIFDIRAQEVIHSAYMPHFRAQMNAVPGMVTNFKFKPTITTDSMRTILGDPNFDYILLCNKVCGTAHYNMQMKIIVESEKDFEDWLSQQKEFEVPESAQTATAEIKAAETVE